MRKVLKTLHPQNGEDINTIIFIRHFEYRCKANKRLCNQCLQPITNMMIRFYPIANIVFANFTYLCTSKPEREQISTFNTYIL